MDEEKGTIYLAYGSNLNLKQMACRCPTAQVLGSARLTGYRLLFRGGNGGAVATIEKQKGGSVPVLLWRITPYDEEALDRYEGYPHLYRKETVKVRFKGQWVPAMAYIMNEGRPLGTPSRYYYEVIRQGYMDAGFDISVLNKAVHASVSQAEKSEV
ncbi:MAG: gamma-glutamylcyclotransferase [Firmicutes bacterium]|nr:gamma-glutamylcyclotransferase [Bacillota bacterium]